MYKLKITKNVELESVLKIVTDERGGKDITVQLDDLCFKPDLRTYTPSKDSKDRFQQLPEKYKATCSILACQWSGKGGESFCRIYRGSKDLEHLVATICVGDTCGLDFEGQTLPSDGEYGDLPLIFDITGEMSIWIRVRKLGFNSFSAENARWGAFEDDNVEGPRVDPKPSKISTKQTRRSKSAKK